MHRIFLDKEEEKEDERNSERSNSVAELFCSKSGGFSSYCREKERRGKDREDKPAKGRKIKALQQGLSFPMTHTSSIVN